MKATVIKLKKEVTQIVTFETNALAQEFAESLRAADIECIIIYNDESIHAEGKMIYSTPSCHQEDFDRHFGDEFDDLPF